jgi:hypothetical protein
MSFLIIKISDFAIKSLGIYGGQLRLTGSRAVSSGEREGRES